MPNKQTTISLRSLLLLCLLFLITLAHAQKPELVVPIGHTDNVNAVAYSSNGHFVVSGSQDNTLKLWETKSGKLLHSFEGHLSAVKSVVFSPDNQFLLSGSDDNTVRLWDLGSGKLLKIYKGHLGGVNAVAFSPNGRFILSGSNDRVLNLWDLGSGKLLRSFLGHSGDVNTVAFSPNGFYVISGSDDKSILLWELSSGKLLRSFEGHGNVVTSVAFSSDNHYLLSGSWDNTAKLWEVSSGKFLRSFEGHENIVTSVAFSPDNRYILSGSWDKMIKLWDTKSGQFVRTFRGHTDYVSSVAFSPDGHYLLSGSWDDMLRLWEVKSGEVVYSPSYHVSPSYSVSFSPKGYQIISGSYNVINLWKLNSGKVLQNLKGHNEGITSVAFSPDDRYALSGSFDKTLRLWEVNSDKLLRSFEGYEKGISSVAFSPNSRYVLSGSVDEALKLWEIDSGKLLHTFEDRSGGVNSVIFSPDGLSVLTGCVDNTIKLWEVSSGKLLRLFEGHTSTVESVAFSSDGRYVLSGSLDKTARLWDVQTGRQIRIFEGGNSPITTVAFYPDETYFVTGSWDNTVQIWNVQTGYLVRTFRGHTGRINSVVLSPDARFIVSCSDDNTTKIWGTQNGKEIATLIAVDSTDWVVTTPSGLFDASPGAMKLMHYVVNDSTDQQEPWKVIEFDNLKQRYYQPGLLPILMGYSKEPLRQVPAFERVALPPAISLALEGSQLQVQLQNRKGGIGAVSVFLNGAERVADLRPNPAQDSTRGTNTLSLDLSRFARYLDTLNQIQVVAYNAEGWIRSRPQTIAYRPLVQAKGDIASKTVSAPAASRPRLRAVVVGNSNVGLRFAHHDAEQMANGLRLAASELLGSANVQVQVLTSQERSQQPGSGTATFASRTEIIKALKTSQSLHPQDVFVLYLSGHGLNYGGADGEFYYLTAGATSADADYLKDPAIRQQYALSSKELASYLNDIPARKKVLVLDVCAAGRGAEQLILASREVPPSQVRALDQLQDRTGFYVLAGSAANAVSYEANVYGQGLLTYALLKGMKGGRLRTEGIHKYLDVEGWLRYAEEQVPQLARGVGGIQQPFYRKGNGTVSIEQEARSFDIGKVTEQVQQQIRLAEPKPVLVVESFQDNTRPRDVLDLGNVVRTALIDLSARGADAPVAYVEAKEYPGAYAIGGRYTVVGEQITVNCVVFQGEKEAGEFNVTGFKANLSALAGQILTKARAVTKP